MESPMPGSTAYEFTPYRLVPAQRQLVRDGAPVKLGGRAFDVLVALVERRDRTVSKNELMDLVWPTVVVEENNLEVQIFTLRKLLGYAAIATVPGRGYRFTLPVAADGNEPALAAPALVGASPVHSNLPVSAPTLYGRDDDLRALRQLIDEHPVVTVAGAGGIGKTRLAQSTANERALQQTGDVWWVELASLSDPALLPVTVARALGVPLDNVPDPTQAVLAALRGRTALLVLDNAEHLLDGVAAFVAAVRECAAQVRLLVTSQEVLHALDEQVFRPGPLALPAGDDLAAARASGAETLFAVRAQAADPRFELTEDNRAAVVDICRRLDGIPLAIELAAARVPLLGVHGLRQRLDERFNVLTAGARAVMRRHQTLRAALEWSHGLLTPDEQVVLRRLGVFAAGFTLQAAQDLAADEAIDVWDVLEHLGALVDKSLVVAEGDPVPRYRLLETTRLYALERLADAGETSALLQRHARHFLELAEAQDQIIAAHGRGAAALALLDTERDNLLHALAWCERDNSAESAPIGVRLAGALRYYWPSRGLAALGLKLTQAALAKSQGLPPDAHRSRALISATQLHTWMDQNHQALILALEHVNLARQRGDRKALASALSQAGLAACFTQRDDESREYLLAALEEARAINDLNLQCISLSGLAALDGGQGRLAESAARFDEVIKLRRGAGQAFNLAASLINAADAWLALDRPDKARVQLQEVATLLPAIDSRFIGQSLVDHAATLVALRKDWPLAVQLLGAGVALRQTSAMPAHGRLVRRHEREQAQARAALGPTVYADAWSRGQTTTYGEAVRLAEEVLGEAELPISGESS